MKNWEFDILPLAAEPLTRQDGALPGSATAETVNVAPTVTIAPGLGAAPAGDQFRINTITDGDEWNVDLIALADGGFVATWVAGSQDYGTEIVPIGYAQRYDAAGAAVGPAMPIGTEGRRIGVEGSGHVGLIALDGGGFVAFHSFKQEDGPRDIYAQRYDDALMPAGDPFRVNSVVDLDQAWPTGAALEGGGFVFTWEGPDGGNTGIFAQIFDADGSPVGEEFRANAVATYGQLMGETIALPGGGFLISWVSAQPTALGGGDIFAQRFDAAGNRVGGEFKVNSYIPGTQWNHSIAVLEDGGLIFVWDGRGADGFQSIFGRRFDADGNPLGPDFRINEYDGVYQQGPSVTALPGGGFAVVWDVSTIHTDNILARTFDAAGDPVGPQFVVSPSTADGQQAPRVKALADGRFVAIWSSREEEGDPGSGVYGRMFAPAYHAAEQEPLDLTGAIRIGDADASAVMTVTLSVDHGVLGVLAGSSGAAVDGNGTGTVMITGTLAQIQALLGGEADSAVGYLAADDAPPATASLTVLVDDGGNGADEALSASVVETIHIQPVNDAPVNHVGGTAAELVGDPIALTGIAVADPDAAGEITVHLGVAHGTLAILTDVPGGIGADDISGGGNGTGGITLTATAAQINATLAADGGLIYRGEAGFTGLDALTVSTHDGLFTDAPRLVPFGGKGVGAGPSDIAAADLNGDGKLDLVVANKTSGTVGVLLGPGDGSLGALVTYAVGSGPFSVALVNTNANQDNFLDIVVTNSLSGTIGVLRGYGNGTFQAQTTTPMRLAEALVSADFNGDGLADIAVTTRNDGVEVLLGTGNGGFGAAAHHGPGSEAEGPFAPVAIDKGDFNRDGLVDLIVANFAGGTADGSVSLLLGAADGGFAEAIVIPAPTRPRDIAAADLNGDGRLDFALADSLTGSVSVFLGNGDGSFQPGAAYALTRSAVSLAVADLNGDGRPDIIAGVEDTSTHLAVLEILVGQGDGTFVPANPLFVSGDPVALVTGDFNGDGRAEAAYVASGGNSVSTLTNQGTSLSDVDSKPIMVVTPNQAPAGADRTESMPEDGVFVLAASHFGFSDSDGDAFAGVRVAAAPTGGKLFFDADGAGGTAAVEITAFPSALFSAADIAGGKLTFVPPANLNGAGTAWIDFKVQDDGGTGWGGQDADDSANRLTLDIGEVNDAPAPAFAGVLVAEHSQAGSVVGWASATDVDSHAATLSFSLADDAGGRFHIGSSTGAVTVLDRALFDFENASSYEIVIRVTDPDGAFATVGATIGLTDIAEVLTGGPDADSLEALSDEDWVLQGAGGADQLFGHAGNDRIDGGAGADFMDGGSGDDVYQVDVPTDFVVEIAGGGSDTVNSSVNYTLPADVEQLVLAGGALNGLGNGLANRIVGTGADNSLDGGGGADSLEGGAGDDFYVVDASADRVVELAGQGFDTVHSSASYTLSDHVEQLKLTGGGSNNGTGNGLANTITGNNGNNRLDGKAGADTMAGGAGHDTYVVNSALDLVIEAGSSGTDTVESAIAFRLPTHFEKLILTGGLGYDGTGNAGANMLTGNSGGNFLNGGRGDDIIDGGAGNDRLMGNLGQDRLTGGAGDDRFYFNVAPGGANADDILDFSAADDSLYLLRSAFTRAGANGTLSASAFHPGSAAADAGDRILYDAATGSLFYDADGTGAAAPLLFATVDAGTPLSHADFVIYG